MKKPEIPFLVMAILFCCFFTRCASTENAKTTKNGLQSRVRNFPNPLNIFQDTTVHQNIRKEASKQLIEEDAASTPKILHDVCSKEPALLTVEIISYLGEKRFTPGFPLIQNAIERHKEPEFIYDGIYSLAQMRESSINKYIISYCDSLVDQERYKCLLAISDSENKKLRERAIPYFKKILEDKALTNTKILFLAKHFLKNTKLAGKIYPLIPSTGDHSTTVKPDSVKKPKAETPSTSIPIPPPPTTVAIQKTLPKSIPKIKSKPKPTPKLTSRPRLQKSLRKSSTHKGAKQNSDKRDWDDNSYKDKVKIFLHAKLGTKATSHLMKKINRRLKRLSRQNGLKTRFLISSYSRFFGKAKLSLTKAKDKIRKGIGTGGSLHAIAKNIKKEYSTHSMQAYSLSVLLGVDRSEAKLILQVTDEI